MPRNRTIVAAACAALVLVGFVVFLVFGSSDPQTVLVVNNLLQTVAAAGSGLVCALVAWRGRTGRRTGWAAMAVALVGWGAGQAYWSWSEIVAELETPFPSVADIGFLIFPVAAALAVTTFSSGAWRRRTHLLAIWDGLIVSAALYIISWALVLDPVYSAGGSTMGLGVALAYPIGDLVVVALVFRLLTQLTSGRLPMVLLSAGLVSMAVADSGFAYLSTAGTYHTGSVIDVGWVAAFLLCAVAAVADSATGTGDENEFGLTRFGLLLPLLPFSFGMSVISVKAWEDDLDHPLVVGAALLMVLIVVRQMLVLAENGHLMATVREREEQLRHQAFHDPLTGLANRLLFQNRLGSVVAYRQHDRSGLTVLFLDLDSFKQVNDRWGHPTGDALLKGVAGRLHACLRDGDTVARLGGDEFAVLLQHEAEDAEALAGRIVAAMEMSFQLGRHQVAIGVSVGVATVPAEADDAAVAERLLQRADIAMYAAKRISGGSYVVYRDGMGMPDGVTETLTPAKR